MATPSYLTLLNTAGVSFSGASVVGSTLTGSTLTTNTAAIGSTLTGSTLVATGSVGIGTTAPTKILTIAGPTTAASSASEIFLTNTVSGGVTTAGGQIGKLTFDNSGAVAGSIKCVTQIGGANNTGALTFGTTMDYSNSDIERMRITRDGNVGIGTTAPSKALTITRFYQNGGTHAEATDSALLLNTTLGFGAGIQLRVPENQTVNQSDLQFTTCDNGGSQVARMTILGTSNANGGYVGIGTAAPQNILHVSGTAVNGDVSRQEMFRALRPATSGVQNGVSMAVSLGANTNGINPYGSIDFKANGFPAAGNAFGYTPDVTIMSLIGNGNVGIGTTAPTSYLTVNSSAYQTNQFIIRGQEFYQNGYSGTGIAINAGLNRTDNKQLWIMNPDHAINSTNPVFRIWLSGTALALGGISTDASTVLDLLFESNIGSYNDAIRSCGTASKRWSAVYAANGTIQTSDSNQKDAQPLPYGINEVLQMRTIKYKWKSQVDLPDTDPQKNFEYYGFCADELAPIFPELVYDENKETPVQMNYSEILPVVVNAIKEEHAVITSHTTAIASLESIINAQQSTINALLDRIAKLESPTAST